MGLAVWVTRGGKCKQQRVRFPCCLGLLHCSGKGTLAVPNQHRPRVELGIAPLAQLARPLHPLGVLFLHRLEASRRLSCGLLAVLRKIAGCSGRAGPGWDDEQKFDARRSAWASCFSKSVLSSLHCCSVGLRQQACWQRHPPLMVPP